MRQDHLVTSAVSLILPGDLLLRGPTSDHFSIGLLAPLSGVMGISGPSILNCALLAAEQTAERTGVPVDLVVIDAGRGAADAALVTRQLVNAGLVRGLVGAHTSDVREAVSDVVANRLPYIFTPPHERQAGRPGTIFTGSGPRLQLQRPLEWIVGHHRLQRWALIGNDYIWPRQVHRTAGLLLRGLGQTVVMDRLVTLGSVDAERLLYEAQASRAEAILLSLVGRDGITFQRVTAETGAGQRFIRLSTALDENSLLSAGGDSSGMLYAAMPSFIQQEDERHQNLLAVYMKRFGPSAPLPASYAEGCYDGVMLLSELWLSGLLEPTPGSTPKHRQASAAQQGAGFAGPPAASRLAIANENDLLVI